MSKTQEHAPSTAITALADRAGPPAAALNGVNEEVVATILDAILYVGAEVSVTFIVMTVSDEETV